MLEILNSIPGTLSALGALESLTKQFKSTAADIMVKADIQLDGSQSRDVLDRNIQDAFDTQKITDEQVAVLRQHFRTVDAISKKHALNTVDPAQMAQLRDDLDANLAEKTSDVAATKTEITVQTKAIAQLEKELADKIKEIANLQKELKQIQKENKKTEAERVKLTTEQKSTTEQKADKEGERGLLKRDVDKKEAEVSTAQAKVNGLTTKQAEQKEEVGRLESQAKTLGSALTKGEKELKSLESQSQSIANDVANNQEKIDSLSIKMADKAAEMEAASEEDKPKIQVNINEFLAELEMANERQEQLIEKQSNIAAKAAEVAAARSAATENGTNLTNAKEALNATKKDLKKANGDLKSLKTELQTLEGKLEKTEKAIIVLDEKLFQLKAKLEAAEEKINTLKGRETDCKETITQAEEDSDVLGKEINNEQATKSKLEAKQAEQIKQQAELQKNLEAVNVQCDALKRMKVQEVDPALAAANAAEMSARNVSPRNSVAWGQAVHSVNEKLEADEKIEPNKYKVSDKTSGDFSVTLNGKALLHVTDNEINSTSAMQKLPIEEQARLMVAACVAQGHDKNVPLTVKSENKELLKAIETQLKVQGFENVNNTKKAPAATLADDKKLAREKKQEMEQENPDGNRPTRSR